MIPIKAIMKFEDSDKKHHEEVTILDFVPSYTPDPRPGVPESDIMAVYADKDGVVCASSIWTISSTPVFKLLRSKQ